MVPGNQGSSGPEVRIERIEPAAPGAPEPTIGKKFEGYMGMLKDTVSTKTVEQLNAMKEGLSALGEDIEHQIFDNEQVKQLTQAAREFYTAQRENLREMGIEDSMARLWERLGKLEEKAPNRSKTREVLSAVGETAGDMTGIGVETVAGTIAQVPGSVWSLLKEEYGNFTQGSPRWIRYLGIGLASYGAYKLAKWIVAWGDTSKGFFNKLLRYTGLLAVSTLVVNHYGAQAAAGVVVEGTQKAAQQESEVGKSEETQGTTITDVQPKAADTAKPKKQEEAGPQVLDITDKKLEGVDLLHRTEPIMVNGHRVQVERTKAAAGKPSVVRFVVDGKAFRLDGEKSRLLQTVKRENGLVTFAGIKEITNPFTGSVITSIPVQAYITNKEIGNVVDQLVSSTGKKTVKIPYFFEQEAAKRVGKYKTNPIEPSELEMEFEYDGNVTS